MGIGRLDQVRNARLGTRKSGAGVHLEHEVEGGTRAVRSVPAGLMALALFTSTSMPPKVSTALWTAAFTPAWTSTWTGRALAAAASISCGREDGAGVLGSGSAVSRR